MNNQDAIEVRCEPADLSHIDEPDNGPDESARMSLVAGVHLVWAPGSHVPIRVRHSYGKLPDFVPLGAADLALEAGCSVDAPLAHMDVPYPGFVDELRNAVVRRYGDDAEVLHDEECNRVWIVWDLDDYFD